MLTPGENTSADRHHRLTLDQMPPALASGDVTAGHGTAPRRLARVVCLADVEPERVTWLWPRHGRNGRNEAPRQ